MKRARQVFKEETHAARPEHGHRVKNAMTQAPLRGWRAGEAGSTTTRQEPRASARFVEQHGGFNRGLSGSDDNDVLVTVVSVSRVVGRVADEVPGQSP